MTALSTVIGRGTTGARPAAGTAGALYYSTTDSTLYRDSGTAWESVEGAGGGGSGTVTSVGLTVPGILSVSGSPVTTSGTLAVTLATETANQVLAGPTSGGSTTPAFRALVAADLPASSSSTPYPAGELGYTQITTASLSTTSTSLVDLTGVTVTVTIGSRPVVVSAYISQWAHTAPNAEGVVALVDSTAGANIQLAVINANASGNGNEIFIAGRVNPASGSRIYKVQFETITAGTLTVNAGATQPAYIQVAEV